MYERMLDKTHQPEINEFFDYCGETKVLFKELNRFMLEDIKTENLLRFPYGKKYGWGIKYSTKRRHICDVFAEKDAFTVMLRMTNLQFEEEYNTLSDYTKRYIDNRYPCGDGGRIHYRVLNEVQLKDIETMLRAKTQK